MSKAQLHFFLFLILLGGFSACKVQSKKQVSKAPVSVTKTTKKDDKPFITAMKCTYQLKDSSSLQVFYQIEIENFDETWRNDIAAFDKIFRTTWTIQPDGGVKEKLKTARLAFTPENTTISNNDVFVNFEIPRLREYKQVNFLIEFADLEASRKFTNETLIDNSGDRINNRYSLYKNNESYPSFDAFLKSGESVTVKSFYGEKKQLYLKYYSTDSPPALSPMSTTKRSDIEGFKDMGTVSITTNEPIKLENKGTYVLLEDSSRLDHGYGFLVVEDIFPKMARIEEVKEPLFYMSTNKEIESLKKEAGAKASLDQYLLGISSGNQTQARQILRSYFKRVEMANKLFTNYKEGWKTDRGMVYIILGPPSRIQKSGQREVWLYAQNQNLSEIIFNFYRKPNQFSEDNYELVRYPEYGAFWYPFVEAWRTGSILE